MCSMTMFNLFRSRDVPHLLCAVPQERTIPDFLQADTWVHSGTVRAEESASAGFNARTARDGARFNGFYLFEQY